MTKTSTRLPAAVFATKICFIFDKSSNLPSWPVRQNAIFKLQLSDEGIEEIPQPIVRKNAPQQKNSLVAMFGKVAFSVFPRYFLLSGRSSMTKSGFIGF
jgi:hypothetical protein